MNRTPSPKRPGEILAELRFRNVLAEAFPTWTLQERKRISQAATACYVGELAVIEAAPQAEGVALDFQGALGAINEKIHHDAFWHVSAQVIVGQPPMDFRALIVKWLGLDPAGRRQDIVTEHPETPWRSMCALIDAIVFLVVVRDATVFHTAQASALLQAIGGRVDPLFLAPGEPVFSVPAWPESMTVFPLSEPVRGLAKALSDDMKQFRELRWCLGRCLDLHKCTVNGAPGPGGPLFQDRNRRTKKNPTVACCDAHRQQVAASRKRFFSMVAASPDLGGLRGLGPTDNVK